MNVQAIIDPDGYLLWTSGALSGSVRDTAAARIWRIPAGLRQAGMAALVDKGYAGCGEHRFEPTRTYARLRARGERVFAPLKTWRILRELRCRPQRATTVTRAIIAFIQTGRMFCGFAVATAGEGPRCLQGLKARQPAAVM